MESLIWYVVSMIVSYYVSALLTPTPEAPKPAAFEDFNFPQLEEGTPQMVCFGDVWIEDWFILGLGNFKTEEIHGDGGKK